jgi:hypothetical protein
MTALRVVKFKRTRTKPRGKPLPIRIFTKEDSRAFHRLMHAAFRIDARRFAMLASMADVLYRRQLREAREPHNIGKPVIDLTGDDREGA